MRRKSRIPTSLTIPGRPSKFRESISANPSKYQASQLPYFCANHRGIATALILPKADVKMRSGMKPLSVNKRATSSAS